LTDCDGPPPSGADTLGLTATRTPAESAFTIGPTLTPGGPAVQAKPFSPGDVVAERYEVVSILGEGGYGAVYRARQRTMDREVALKVIRPEHAQNDALFKRFEREARALSRLKSPHIVPVFDFGRTPDGMLYLAMELLEGRTLKSVIAEEAPLSPVRAARLAAQICEALAEAHEYQPADADRVMPIVHRDLKPANVIVSRTKTGTEHCYLLDFGIVRFDAEDSEAEADVSLTRGLVIGTPHFMAPEQAEGERVSAQTDLWALGVILYQALAAKLPFNGASAQRIVTSVLRDPYPPLAAPSTGAPIPPELVRLVHALLDKNPAQRPASAREVQRVLAEIVGSTTAQPSMRPVPRASSGPGIWIGLGAGLVAIAAIGALALWPTQAPSADKAAPAPASEFTTPPSPITAPAAPRAPAPEAPPVPPPAPTSVPAAPASALAPAPAPVPVAPPAVTHAPVATPPAEPEDSPGSAKKPAAAPRPKPAARQGKHTPAAPAQAPAAAKPKIVID